MKIFFATVFDPSSNLFRNKRKRYHCFSPRQNQAGEYRSVSPGWSSYGVATPARRLVTVGGITMIACFATSSVTRWMSVALIPPSALMKDILQTINFSIITLGTSLLGLSLPVRLSDFRTDHVPHQ